MLKHPIAMFSIATSSKEEFGRASVHTACRQYPETCTACESITRSSVTSSLTTSSSSATSPLSTSTSKSCGCVSCILSQSDPSPAAVSQSDSQSNAFSQSGSPSIVINQPGSQSIVFSRPCTHTRIFEQSVSQSSACNQSGLQSETSVNSHSDKQPSVLNESVTQSNVNSQSETQPFAFYKTWTHSTIYSKALAPSSIYSQPASQSLALSQSVTQSAVDDTPTAFPGGQEAQSEPARHVNPVKQPNEGHTFWRGFEDNPSQPVDENNGQQTDDSSIETPKCTSIEVTDRIRESETDMATMAGNRKLCKLDAICAKLKSKGPSGVVESLEQETNIKHIGEDDDDVGHDEMPTDLSTKCLNNNIIGKVDLQRTDITQHSTAEDTNHENDLLRCKQPTADINKPAETQETELDTSVDTSLDLSRYRDISSDKAKLLPGRKVDTFQSIGSSRRKSRKASTPRNIAQVRDLYTDNIDDKDELADYEINNLNTNFPPEESEDTEVDSKENGTNNIAKSSFTNSPNVDNEDENSNHSSALNYSKSSSSLNQSSNSKRSTLSSDVSDIFDDSAPLDLSVSKSNEYDHEISSDNEEYFHNDRSLVIDEDPDKPKISRPSSPIHKPRDVGVEHAAHLKDYAESTMNELISMYGFGGPVPSEFPKHLPPMNNLQQILAANLRPLTGLPPGLPLIPTKKPKLSIDSESDDGSQHGKSMMSHYNLGPGNQNKHEGGAKLQNDRFTSSSSFINAVYNANSNPSSEQLLTQKTLLPNYSKYLKRYNTGSECGGQHCNDLNYKEHYHCIDCSFQVFIKKEEMVRHYKWHKKREESLQHGFLRFSPLDNCTKRFGPCTHNRKQTHYHCLQKGCDKVYISTSDVQMHANYHRKDSAIMSEGFQRFRATEDCGTQSCAFYGQRTTHFHCLRPDCKFTFKNKADMEKHKSYHQKDEVLGRDGFKKFMKYEHCQFQGCRYSKLSNHIHCIRSGCDYILHSTAQLYSHKRKHERRDFETAYKHFRTNQPTTAPPIQNKMMIPRNDFGSVGLAQSVALKPAIQSVPTSVIQARPDLKRPISLDSSMEPSELKKPKIEPKSEVNSDVDMSAPASPMNMSMGRSSPYDTFNNKGGYNESMEDAGSDCSDLPHNEAGKHPDSSSYDEDSIDLSGSLNLQIPLLQHKTEMGTSQQEDSKQPISLQLPVTTPQLPSAFSSINSTMPGTLPGSLVSMMNSGTLMTVPSTLTGASTVLQPPKSVYNERREKDDSWKTYLVRYTANDPCNPRCQYLYKDHYHCKMDGCLVLFKSKDGVREHARFHELQDRITPIAYKEYAQTEACPDACQYSETERHYHCIWTGCTHVVPYIGPTFGRLEHYRIHEYARAAAGKAYSRSGRSMAGGLDDNHIRRRGRPPKYPKIELPRIPKVELTDEEIQQSHAPLKNSEILSDTKVINGFRIFNSEDPCPDEQCGYTGRLHYHCARPRCFTITDRIDVLNLHAKDFHSFVKILEGYEFFDRNVSCRRTNCPNNQINRHFHCTRPKCDYSFIRHSTMSQHEKKHGMTENGTYSSVDVQEKPLSPTLYRRDVPIRPAVHTNSGQSVPISPLKHSQQVKPDTGAYPNIKPHLIPNIPMLFPVSQGSIIIPQGAAGIQQANMASSTTGPAVPIALPISTIQALPPYVTSSHLVAGIPNSLVATANTEGATVPPEVSGSSAPLTVLLQRGINQIPQPSWTEIKAKMHYALSQNCGRPFCKLKKKDHYHCYDCNQAFSDPARLRSHIGKHGIKFKKGDVEAQPLALVGQNKEEKPSASTDDIENGEMDPDEACCLAADNGNLSDSESEEDKNSSSLNLNPSTFSEMISKAQEQNKFTDFPDSVYGLDDDAPVDYSRNTGSPDTDNLQESVDLSLDLSSRSGRKITKTKHDGFMNSGDINLNKQRQVGNLKSSLGAKSPYKAAEPINHKPYVNHPGPPIPRMKDDSVPNGYSRWKYNEECNYPKCAYRHSVTHFHCNRPDCGYGFSDRSRLVQHSLRHERIDSITGGELQQYRINQDCEEPSCDFNKKMSHFHCKRCSYNCTDSSKVLTHRKYHAKLDSIASQGFQKYSASEECGVDICAYTKKQTHFHCLVDTCKAAVLGVPQMNSHKTKHVANIHYAAIPT